MNRTTVTLSDAPARMWRALLALAAGLALLALAFVPARASAATPAELQLLSNAPSVDPPVTFNPSGLSAKPGLFNLRVSGFGDVPGFCADLPTVIEEGITYNVLVDPADPATTPNAGRIGWLVANAETLIAAEQGDDQKELVAGAIQTAIWVLLGQANGPNDDPPATSDAALNAKVAEILALSDGNALAGPLTLSAASSSTCAGSAIALSLTGTPGTTADLAITSGLGSLSATQVTFDAQGTASATVSSASPGQVTVQATAVGGTLLKASKTEQLPQPQDTVFVLPESFVAQTTLTFDNCQAPLTPTTPATPSTPPVTPTPPVTRAVSVCPKPRLRTSIRGPRAPIAGQLATYVVRVANTNRRNRATNVRLRIRIPAGFSLARRVKGATLRRGVLTKRLPNIAPRRARTVRVVLRVDRTTLGRRGIRARATARCNATNTRLLGLRVRGVSRVVQPAVTG